MGQTAIYKLRWPERTGGKPNGPNDYKNLASDVDDQMVRYRSRTSFEGWMNPAIIINPNQQKVITSQLITPRVRGWITVEYQLNIIGWTGGNFGGWTYAHIGLASASSQPLARAHRMHNEHSGTMWYTTGRMSFSTLDLQPIRFHIDVYNDLPSSNYLRVPYIPFSVQHYGGKSV